MRAYGAILSKFPQYANGIQRRNRKCSVRMAFNDAIGIANGGQACDLRFSIVTAPRAHFTFTNFIPA
jgi:hypothetical protein